MLPYAVGAVVAVNVMHVCMLQECEGDGNAGVGSGGDIVAVSVYIGGTRCSGVLSSAGDALEMSVVRSVGGVCDMCMCLARGGVGGVVGERIRFGVYQSWRNMVEYVSVFWLLWCRWVAWAIVVVCLCVL